MSRQPFLPLHGQVAIIAGGTGGIGYMVAVRLVHVGAQVGSMLRSDLQMAAAQAVELPSKRHGAMLASIADNAALQSAVVDVATLSGRADIPVNAAGMTKPVPHKELDALDIRAYASRLRASGNGQIVNISSTAAAIGIGSNAAYCATKALLDAMAVSFGRALSPEIRVVNASPGVANRTYVPGGYQSWSNKQAATTTLKQIKTPKDMATVIEVCATTLKFDCDRSFRPMAAATLVHPGIVFIKRVNGPRHTQEGHYHRAWPRLFVPPAPAGNRVVRVGRRALGTQSDGWRCVGKPRPF
jgi:3-oxoacyl-[acyl-carrier protein] reductase